MPGTRARGYVDGHREVLGSSFREDLVEEGDCTQQSRGPGHLGAAGTAGDHDAVFVANDVMALGALAALPRLILPTELVRRQSA